ncbi:YbhB/YbcL family Raf kinase inhibitor-like protein [Neolewinella sp.]|uniref:YbhB/YbcL family Raf kinase inhibitor-like protein n=1 Tax=Neolewinella sp. TaxID=2993543 RepID=UPI003B52ED26
MLKTLTLPLLFLPPLLRAQGPDVKSANVEVVGHVVEPRQLPPAADDLSVLRLPEGFTVNVFARELENPRMLAVAEDGTVYVTRRKLGDVMLLRDTDGDGTADEQRVVANRPGMHGIAITGDTMYLTTVKDLYMTTIKSDGSLDTLTLLLDDLPDGGQHPNRMVVVGPDKHLYLTAGSTCNACAEPNPENATMLRIAPDGSSRSIYASGLRNTIGYGFAPGSGKLYGMDHGIDWLGDNEQHEELNQIVKGNAYGWPYIYADGKYNPADYPPDGITMEDWKAQSAEAIGLYIPHAAPMQLAYYRGSSFPADYRGDAYIAMRGSWNRQPPSGYEVVRIHFENGEPVSFEPFVQGFVTQEGDEWGHRGRLCGLAETTDGSLLFTDDTNGVIYRVSYAEGGGVPIAIGSANNPGKPTNEDGADVRMTGIAPPTEAADTPDSLAMQLTEASTKLSVSSSAFANESTIPNRYAAEQENISPPLAWSGAPEGTQSFVVLMEDPAVPMHPPFLHWSLYNVPADKTELAEATPGGPTVPGIEGALQGPNDYGSLGYYGPRPPKGDPAHPYHFQVFALDTELELPFGASRAELLEAMRGHVLASGEVIGTYRR